MNATQYPIAPGSKEPTTSQAAARSIRLHARRLRDECLCLLRTRDLTADQCAKILKRSPLTIRPRLSELRALGLIEDTGGRSVNASGQPAKVWMAVQ